MPQTTCEAALDRFALLLVPSTDLAACLLASDLASHLVPGTDLAACLLANVLAPHLVPGTDLAACLPPFQG
jgi:hypothetical protein